jgi:phage-related minor tail protein
VVTLITSAVSTSAAAVILGVQAVIFAIGAIAGPKRHPYGLIFAGLVAPRLGPVRNREPVPPLKFAQLVGLVFAAVGVTGFATGALYVGVVATGAALVAALLNAAFGICLGCQLYPLLVRLRPAPKAAETT